MTEDHFAAVQTFALSKRFGARVAVDNVSLEVPANGVFGLVGPNGAGKTTLLRLILGLTAPNAGLVIVGGRRLPKDARAVLSRSGALIDEPRFYMHLSARENLELIAAARGYGAKERIDAALATMDLSDRANDRVGKYSMGMRQRLAVARSLLGDPRLLILDEPSNGLDPAGIREFRALIRQLANEGRTVILSTHLLAEVERTCDQAAIMHEGRIIAQAPIDELAGGEGLEARFLRLTDTAKELSA